MARRKKKRTHVKVDESANPNAPKIPKSFVIRSGEVGKTVTALVQDMRKVMEPNTAERKNNRLKDFLSVAGQFGVTHFLIFTRTEYGTNLRIARSPRGPTLCFKVENYSLTRDVLASQLHPKSPGAEYHTSPLLVLNNFGGDEKQTKLLTTMFQNMFPPINVKTMQLSEARRVVLFSYNIETKQIDFRHYSIIVKPVGISKSIKKIITGDSMPDLHNLNDISEFVLKEGQVSESEASDVEESIVTLAEDFVGRNNKKSDQRAIRLIELGPRLSLKLVKIQSGLCDGEVLFHEFIYKTPEEIRKMEREREQRKQLAALRRKQQEENVAKKKAEKEVKQLATGGRQQKREDTRASKQQNDDNSDGDEIEKVPPEHYDDDEISDEDEDDLDDELSDVEYDFKQSDYNMDNLFDEAIGNDVSSVSYSNESENVDEQISSSKQKRKHATSIGKPKFVLKNKKLRK
ncbi:8581_t:CDS:2 [Ambispora gerdemannii]|uniref:8581_t:CDS:1 n=1 Tax=Ambispora gerdemannii TaxID=144530 RepID=A0A9N8ZLX1_9GLOM|nr:8581_t:CDS:2 [Ambispora gerdemannii]